MILSVEERDRLFDLLTQEQRSFLSDHLTRSRRTVFANAMAQQKGLHIPENANPEDIEILLSDWVYVGYIDGGKVSGELRCECGRPLRYQHHVEHKSTGEKMKFGIDHLKEHLGIDAAVVAAVKKGFDAIDYELDEILLKIQNGWEIDPQLLQVSEIPKDIQLHLDHGLPLLEKQVRKLRQQQVARIRTSSFVQPSTSTRSAPVVTDLFSWSASTSKSKEPAPLFELPDRLKEPVRSYIQKGIRSARVICELLIKEHGATDSRFITGKPQIYVAVCKYIEDGIHAELASSSSEDRQYSVPN